MNSKSKIIQSLAILEILANHMLNARRIGCMPVDKSCMPVDKRNKVKAMVFFLPVDTENLNHMVSRLTTVSQRINMTHIPDISPVLLQLIVIKIL